MEWFDHIACRLYKTDATFAVCATKEVSNKRGNRKNRSPSMPLSAVCLSVVCVQWRVEPSTSLNGKKPPPQKTA